MVVTEALQKVSYRPILRPFSAPFLKFHFPISILISHEKRTFPYGTVFHSVGKAQQLLGFFISIR